MCSFFPFGSRSTVLSAPHVKNFVKTEKMSGRVVQRSREPSSHTQRDQQQNQKK